MATTPRKDPQPNISDLRDRSQSIFRPILTRIQKKKKKKKKSCHPYRVRYSRGRVSNFNQSEARKHCFLSSDWLKFETLPRKYRTLYIDQLKCGIRPDPPDPPDPTLFGKPLCEKTERDRDMKISGFVDLDTADALKYVKI